MSSKPRARIARLAQSLGDRTPARPAVPHRRRPVLTRAFDYGDPVSLYADSDPTGANDVDPTEAEPSYAAPPAVPPSAVATHPSAVETRHAVVSAEPAVAEPQPAVAAQPSVVERAPAPTPVGTPAAGPSVLNGVSEEVAGWTVPAAADDTSDQSFAEDIQAILAHAQSLPNARRVPLPDVPTAPPAPVQPAPMHGVGAGTTHDVFDQMAAANTPSRFHQGPVSLSVDFDRLDRALEDIATPTDAPTPPGQAGRAVADPALSGGPAAPAAPDGNGTTAGAVPVPAAVPPAGGAAPVPDQPSPVPTGAFRVMTDVPLVAQAPGLSCHAAACASMVAWRDEVAPDTAALAAAGGYWERYADGRTAVYPDVLEVFGLGNASIGKPPSAAELRELIDTQGPLFVAAAPPGEHAVVVTGLAGDGTATGTVIDVVDPWAVGMTTYSAPNPGSRYSVPYATLLESVGAGPEHQLVIAHLRKGSS